MRRSPSADFGSIPARRQRLGEQLLASVEPGFAHLPPCGRRHLMAEQRHVLRELVPHRPQVLGVVGRGLAWSAVRSGSDAAAAISASFVGK